MDVEDIMRRFADEAPDRDRRVFARLVVAQLRLTMLRSSAFPTQFDVPMRFADGLVFQVPVRPLIEDGETVVRLFDALSVIPGDDPSIRVLSADVVDVAQARGSVGLVLFLNEHPAMTLGVAPEGDALYMRTEGFDRAVAGTAGELPGLWERLRRGMWTVASKAVARIKRPKGAGKVPSASADGAVSARRRAPKRFLGRETAARSLNLSLPAMTLRRALRPIVLLAKGGGKGSVPTPGAVPLLIPIRGLKTGPGAYPPRPVLERLRHALGVQMLLTDIALRELLGTKTAAETAIEALVGNRLSHLRALGHDHLATRTAFDIDSEVKAWAALKYRHLPEGNRNTAAIHEMRDRELAAIDILAKAYNHAQRAVAAYDKAEGLEVADIAPSLEAVFLEKNNRTGMPVHELFQVAVFADINPVVFWPQHINGFATVFEAGRFMGRLQAGVATEVSDVVADLLLAQLEAGAPQDAPDQLISIVWQAIGDICGHDVFVAMLRRARRGGRTLMVERGTRRLRIIERSDETRQAS